jgi:alpha/beta superfamily hydrolase
MGVTSVSTRPPRTERIVMPGPAGALEALLEIPEQHDAGHFGVVCHPHPLYGGTLENKVVHTLARAFQELRVPTLRFNFRGVGGSAGEFDQGRGEVEDALAVVAYGRQLFPGAALWLAGFSFGGAVAVTSAARAHPERLVLVAPGVALLNVGITAPPCPWLIVQGDADDVIDPRYVLDWAATAGNQAPARPPEIRVLPGAGHFFLGRLHDLRDAVLSFLARSAPPRT